MKVLKFRAWDGSKFVPVHKIEYISAEQSVTGKPGYNINNHLGIPEDYLHQFTGLTDKHGKEIYEEDFVRAGNQLVYCCGYVEEEAAFVLWYGDDYVYLADFQNGNMLKKTDAFRTGPNTLEVISNAFENPRAVLRRQNGTFPSDSRRP